MNKHKMRTESEIRKELEAQNKILMDHFEPGNRSYHFFIQCLYWVLGENETLPRYGEDGYDT